MDKFVISQAQKLFVSLIIQIHNYVIPKMDFLALIMHPDGM